MKTYYNADEAVTTVFDDYGNILKRVYEDGHETIYRANGTAILTKDGVEIPVRVEMVRHPADCPVDRSYYLRGIIEDGWKQRGRWYGRRFLGWELSHPEKGKLFIPEDLAGMLKDVVLETDKNQKEE